MDDHAPVHDIHPPAPRWTHVALRVTDIDATIDWYTTYTPMRLLDRRQDDMGYGAWLGHDDAPDSPFLLVIAQFFPGTDPFKDSPIARLAPFAHLGIELTSREAVEDAATRGDAGGWLRMAPTDMPPPIGYICMLSDPDGNMVEFSHDQGVYALARRLALKKS
ncbi:VOC family protein [Candidatus Poriferisocius sp.]|uniref:VOC family protein n=1 Tax=Candidatus Poriferisocius sp. TaxID=3101276 RepID=UPI003B01594C